MSKGQRMVEFGAALHDAIAAHGVPGHEEIANSLAEQVITLHREALEEIRRIEVQLRERQKDYARSLRQVTDLLAAEPPDTTVKVQLPAQPPDQG